MSLPIRPAKNVAPSVVTLECVRSEGDIFSLCKQQTSDNTHCKTASPPHSHLNSPRSVLPKIFRSCVLFLSSYSLQSSISAVTSNSVHNLTLLHDTPDSYQIRPTSFASPRMPGLPAISERNMADALANLNLAEFVMAEQDRTMTDEVFQITTDLKDFMMQSTVNIEDAQARIEHANAYVRSSLQLTKTVVQECNAVLENLGHSPPGNIQDDNLFAHVSIHSYGDKWYSDLF